MNSRARHAVHLLLALTLLLQGLGAVAVPCDMAAGSVQNHSAGEPAAEDPHAAHRSMSGGAADDDGATACCDSGECASGGCLSLPGVFSSQVPTGTPAPSRTVLLEAVHYLSLVPATPYRPPVLA